MYPAALRIPYTAAVEEHAAGRLGPSQNASFFLALHGVLSQECRRRHAEVFRQTLDVALTQTHRGHAAAIGANRAIDLLLDLLARFAGCAVRNDRAP